jgi:hypothetical protein
VITLHAAGPFSAVLVLADNAMLWQYMVAAKATHPNISFFIEAINLPLGDT